MFPPLLNPIEELCILLPETASAAKRIDKGLILKALGEKVGQVIPNVTAERYCDLIWACMFGLFIADTLMLLFVYLKVRMVWLRVVTFMFGVTLFCALPFLLVLLGCGLV